MSRGALNGIGDGFGMSICLHALPTHDCVDFTFLLFSASLQWLLPSASTRTAAPSAPPSGSPQRGVSRGTVQLTRLQVKWTLSIRCALRRVAPGRLDTVRWAGRLSLAVATSCLSTSRFEELPHRQMHCSSPEWFSAQQLPTKHWRRRQRRPNATSVGRAGPRRHLPRRLRVFTSA